MSLHLGQTFENWTDFHDAVKKYMNETFQPFTKSSSKKVSTHNRSCKKPYPEEMEYFYQCYQCTHRGSFIPKGSGFRETKSYKGGCTAKIMGCLDRIIRRQIIVTIIDDRHNHEIGERIYKSYPKIRCLDGEEKVLAKKLSALNVPPKQLREEMERITGKHVTLQDVQNLKSSHKKRVRDRRGKDSTKVCDVEAEVEDLTDVQNVEIWEKLYPGCYMDMSREVKFGIAKTKLDKIHEKLMQVSPTEFSDYMEQLDKLGESISRAASIYVEEIEDLESLESEIVLTKPPTGTESSLEGVECSVQASSLEETINYVVAMQPIDNGISNVGDSVTVGNIMIKQEPASGAESSSEDVFTPPRARRKIAKRSHPQDLDDVMSSSSKHSRILRDKCNKCRQAEPMTTSASGSIEWVQCNSCVRWFHSDCINYVSGREFSCIFCDNCYKKDS